MAGWRRRALVHVSTLRELAAATHTHTHSRSVLARDHHHFVSWSASDITAILCAERFYLMFSDEARFLDCFTFTSAPFFNHLLFTLLITACDGGCKKRFLLPALLSSLAYRNILIREFTNLLFFMCFYLHIQENHLHSKVGPFQTWLRILELFR